MLHEEEFITTYRGLKSNLYEAEAKSFGGGGEGHLYKLTNVPDKVIKIYLPFVDRKRMQAKLRVMLANPPDSKVLDQITWPTDLLFDGGAFCGFVMPKLERFQHLSNIYKYTCSKPSIPFEDKLIIAKNLCIVTGSVHNAGYIIGDFNPNNIAIKQTGKVAFFDTDSYHVYDTSTGITYRCNASFPGYVAPELLEKCRNYQIEPFLNAPLPTWTTDTDNFALAIHIFQLLMNGFTPFNGIKNNERRSVANPGLGHEAVEKGNYCFKPGNKPLSPAVPPLATLPTNIADLFTEAFEPPPKGQTKHRPSAMDWYSALENYQNNLRTCTKNVYHQYFSSLSSCPWCEADRNYIAELNSTSQPPVKKSISPPIPIPAQQIATVPKPAPLPIPLPQPVLQPKIKKILINIGLGFLGVYILFGIIPFLVRGGFRPESNTETYYQSDSSNSNSGPTSQDIAGETSGSSGPSDSSGSFQEAQPTEIQLQAVSETEARIPGMLYSCDGTLPQQFKKNERVIVCTEEDRLIVRNHASPVAGEEFRIYTGTVVTVLSGPECDGISSWWKIRVDSGTRVYSASKRSHYYLDRDVEGYVKGANQYGDPKEDVHLCNQ